MKKRKVGDMVMVYGNKAMIQNIDTYENKQMYQVKIVRKNKFANEDSKKVTDDEHSREVFFVSEKSIQNYNENESASIKIQKIIRGFLSRKYFNTLACFSFWRKFEHIDEHYTLGNHEKIYKPLIEIIKEDVKNGNILLPLQTVQIQKSNSYSAVSGSSYEIEKCDYINLPKLKEKIDRQYAQEMFQFFVTSKSTVLPIELVRKILTKMEKLLQEKISSSVIRVDMSNKKDNARLIVIYKDEKKENNQIIKINDFLPMHINFICLLLLGDVHGQLNDVLWVFNKFGIPSSENIYLFNGDIADRGAYATEIFLLLFIFKLSCYECVIINRGNHECPYMNEVYGFYNEVHSKYDHTIYELFQNIFQLLSLAVNIQDKFLVVHGGLCRFDDVTLNDIDKLNRKKSDIVHPKNFEEIVIFDLLWADPQKKEGIGSSERGNNCICFGPDITSNFLAKNNLNLLIRSHQVPKRLQGIEQLHNGKCITLFSASNYCNKIKNMAGAIIINKDLTFDIDEYTSPSLEKIRKTFNEKAKLSQRVLHCAKILQMEKQEQRKSRKISNEGIMHDILSSLSILICNNKSTLWDNLYKQDKKQSGYVSILTWKKELENISGVNTVPWIYLFKKLRMIKNGFVNYSAVLNRFKINYAPDERFINIEWKNECFEQLYESLLKADLTLRETLMLFDRDLDGKVTCQDFQQVLQDVNIGLSAEQIRILIRLISSNSLSSSKNENKGHTCPDKIDVAEFIGKIRVGYRLSINDEYRNEEDIQKLIETIGKYILSDSIDTANIHYKFYEDAGVSHKRLKHDSERRRRSSVIKAVALFQKFKIYDTYGNGYLNYDDFVAAIKNFDIGKMSKEVGFNITDEILLKMAKSIDITKSSKINFLEFLQAFYVVNKSKYSYVEELWCHICTIIYKNKIALEKCLKYLDKPLQGVVSCGQFRHVLFELNKILKENGDMALTEEQIDLLSFTIDTDDGVNYSHFLNSFKPVYINPTN